MKKETPLRMCVACRTMRPKTELFRITKPKTGEAVLAEQNYIEGRSAYVCRTKECLEKAFKTRGLERGLHAPLPDSLREALEKKVDGV